MGTTLVALALVDGQRIAVINIGDSRLYTMHAGELRQVTADHNLVAELVAQGRISKEEAEFLRSGDLVTEAELKVLEVEQALAKVREGQAAQREALAGRREELAAQRERAVAERDAATRHVNGGLLGRYERIRRGKAPLALYALHGDACGHCFTAVPTQRRVLIQRGASIEGCEACGVLLYAAE